MIFAPSAKPAETVDFVHFGLIRFRMVYSRRKKFSFGDVKLSAKRRQS
jgi:hypothetical protein